MTDSPRADGRRWADYADRFVREVHRLSATRGWHRYAIAFGFGALTASAMAPFYLLPALVAGYGALVLLLDGALESSTPRRMAFLTGWAFGFGYFLLGMYWLGFAFLVQADEYGWMIPIAVPAFTGFLGLFYAVPVWLASLVWRSGWHRIAILAALIAVFEYARGNVLTGFPWNLTSQAFAGNALLAQPLAWVGPYGYSLVLLMLAMVPALAVARADTFRWRPLAIFVAGVAAILLAGAARLAVATPEAARPGPTLIVVQPNVAQRDKLDPARWDPTLSRMIDFTRTGATGGDAYLAVWPENADPRLLRDPGVPQYLGGALPDGTALISGTIRRWADDDGTVRFGNSAALFGAADPETGRAPLQHAYDKHHLVPFGEYLPMKGLLRSLGLSQLAPVEDGFTPGPGPRVFDFAGLRVSPLICYEDVFPRELYPRSNRPDLLAVLTNDAWFGDNAGPRQHLDISRMRAVESGVPMARSANTGISGVFDAHGRLVDLVGLYEPGFISVPTPPRLAPTLYDRFAELMFFFLVAVVTVTTIFSRVARPR